MLHKAHGDSSYRVVASTPKDPVSSPNGGSDDEDS